MNSPPRRKRFLYAAAAIWLVLTASLTMWWLIFGLRQATVLRGLAGPGAERAGAAHRMLVSEGAFLIALVLAGGIALLVAVRREQRSQQQVRTFFLSFTHDLKTALASLTLQAEGLREDLPAAAHHPSLQRLLLDARRLQLQLENSLYFAEPQGHVRLEPIDLPVLVRRVAEDWPEMTVEVDGAAIVLADRRALESVVRNLMQNSTVHGGAKRMTIRIDRHGPGRLTAMVTDDGRGAPSALVRQLGEPFMRAGTTGGSGVGLHVSRELMKRMQGELRFDTQIAQGFRVVMHLSEVR